MTSRIISILRLGVNSLSRDSVIDSLTVLWTLWKVPHTEPSNFMATDSHNLLATSEATFLYKQNINNTTKEWVKCHFKTDNGAQQAITLLKYYVVM